MRVVTGSLAISLLFGCLLIVIPTSEAGSWSCGGSTYVNDPATEIVQNGGFESDLVNWYPPGPVMPPTISTTIRHSGAKSARVFSFGGAENAYQNLAGPPSVYVLSYWFHVATWGPGGAFAVETLANWNPSFGTADIPTQMSWSPPNTMLWRTWTRNGGGDTSRTYLMTLTTGTWHLIETVIDGSLGIQCLFIDGAYVDSQSVSPAATFLPTVLAFGDISTAGDAGEAYYDDLSIQTAGPAMPDYVPTSPLPSGGIAIGLSLPVPLSVRVTNQGTVPATANSTIAFFNESTPGSPFATFSVPPLGAGAVAGPFGALWWSPSVPGTYRILAEVDSGGAISELDEGNNRFVWTATAYPPPITAIGVGSPNYQGTYVTSSTPLTLSVVDRSGQGILRTQYRFDSGPWVSYSGPFTLAGEAEHLVQWFSEDNVGNVEAVQSLLLRLDDTPPTSTFVITGPFHGGQFITSSSRISLSSVDGGVLPVGVDVLEYSLRGPGWIPYTAPFGFTGSDGARAVSFRARDLLGNTELRHDLALILDNTPPTSASAIAGPLHGEFVSSATRISLSTVDGGSPGVGVSKLEYSMDGQSWSPYVGPFGVAGPDGAKTVYFRATDLLGNEEAPRTLSVVLDSTPPRTELSIPAGYLTLDSEFTLSASDGGSGVASIEYRVDGGAWSAYTGAFSLPLGDHVIEYRSVDRVGNAEPAGMASVRIENWKPIMAVVFSVILLLVGVALARRRSPTGDPRSLWRPFVLGSFPFVIAEAATGIASSLTGLLAFPPVLGLGTFVDGGIFAAGIVAAIALHGRARASGVRPPRA